MPIYENISEGAETDGNIVAISTDKSIRIFSIVKIFKFIRSIKVVRSTIFIEVVRAAESVLSSPASPDR